MNLQLQGKIAMVAASSKGLGYGIAYELAKEGANLSIGSRTETEIKNTARKIEIETSVSVLPTILDFDEYTSIEEEVSKVIRCILDYCDQENRYDEINSQNII